MKILFITSSRIGDAVLSTGLLEYITRTYPDAKVTIACGPLAVSLFEGYPQLQGIIPLQKQKNNKHWFELWKKVVRCRWDIVIDLRDSAVSRLVFAKRRFVTGRHIDKSAHKVIQAAELMKLQEIPNPKLWFTAEQVARAQALIPDGDLVLGIGPTANWIGKTWPAERFIEVVRWMISEDGLFPDARVAVFAAPGEEAAAEQVLASVPKGRALDIIAKTDPGTAAATLARCDFYIGNDSGLMHCAAAAEVSVLGLFGPSYPELYRPWGVHAKHVATPESFDELIDYDGYSAGTAPCLMESLTIEHVIDALDLSSWEHIFERRQKTA